MQSDSPRIRTKTLQEYVDAVVYRDIIERHDITSVQSLRYTLDIFYVIIRVRLQKGRYQVC